LVLTSNASAQNRAQDDNLREELTKKAFAELYAAESGSKDGPYFYANPPQQ
jgi:hypothetical protein